MSERFTCTLDAGGQRARRREWAAFVEARVDSVERGPAHARLRLVAGDGALIAAADLAGREQACCSFFAFSIEVDSRHRWLRVSVPEDAAAGLWSLLSSC